MRTLVVALKSLVLAGCAVGIFGAVTWQLRCQGTGILTRLRDTDLYEEDRQPRTTRRAGSPGPPGATCPSCLRLLGAAIAPSPRPLSSWHRFLPSAACFFLSLR